MININDYQILLTEKDWLDLEKELGDSFGELGFESAQDKYNMLEMVKGKMNLDHWKNEFNYKTVAISINYGYMYTYYKKLDGFNIYEKKDAEKIGYHFWFSYEAESLLARLFTLIDNLYYILNINYDLDVPEGLGFRKNLVSALSHVNQDLSDYLSKLIKDERYDRAQTIRNDFTHNHSPLNLTSGFKKVENGHTFSKGEYMEPDDVVECMDNFINLLEELTNEIKRHI